MKLTDCFFVMLYAYSGLKKLITSPRPIHIPTSDMPQIVEATLVLLREESTCQQIESDNEDEDDTEHDEVLMDAVSDLLPAFATVLGSQFAPIFSQLFEPLMKFAVSKQLLIHCFIKTNCILFNLNDFYYLLLQKQSRPPQDRTMVVATLAEVAQHMGAPIASYVDVIINNVAIYVFFLIFYISI